MKRFAQLVILSLFYVATWAQPTQVGKYPPMVGEPKREDFPQEVDKQPINATFTFAILPIYTSRKQNLTTPKMCNRLLPT